MITKIFYIYMLLWVKNISSASFILIPKKAKNGFIFKILRLLNCSKIYFLYIKRFFVIKQLTLILLESFYILDFFKCFYHRIKVLIKFYDYETPYIQDINNYSAIYIYLKLPKPKNLQTGNLRKNQCYHRKPMGPFY